MQCEDAELALSALFDGDLGRVFSPLLREGSKLANQPDENTRSARELFLHLAACRACRELLAQIFLLRAVCWVARGQWGKVVSKLGKEKLVDA